MSKRTSIMWREGMLDMYGVRKRRCDYHKWLVNANKNYRKKAILFLTRSWVSELQRSCAVIIIADMLDAK